MRLSELLVAVVLCGCSAPGTPQQQRPPSNDPVGPIGEPSLQTGYEPPANREPPPTPHTSSPPYDDGEKCLQSSDCKSGICEGEGCSADRPGVCASAQRGCTRDLRPYCGCDGATFRTSGSCPGIRFAHKGEC